MADNIFALMPAAWLRDQFLATLDLTNAQGEPYPDSFYDNAIRSAVSFLEQRLAIDIKHRRYVDEKQSQFLEDRHGFFPVRLNRRPLREVLEFRIDYGNLRIINVPLQWILVTSYRFGTLRMVPTSNSAQYSQIVGWPVSWNRQVNPSGFRITYTTGFMFETGEFTITAPDDRETVVFAAPLSNSDYTVHYALVEPAEADENIVVDTVEQGIDNFTAELSAAPSVPLTVRWYATNIPDTLFRAVGLYAALTIIPQLSSNVIGSGLSSLSVSQDGISQSWGAGGYKTLMDAYQAQLAELMTVLSGQYSLAIASVR